MTTAFVAKRVDVGAPGKRCVDRFADGRVPIAQAIREILTRMGDTSPLDVCMGSKDGASMNVRSATPITITDRRETVLSGKLAKWNRVLVRTVGVGGTPRVWVLDPGPDENEIAFGPFHVRGRFMIADKSNNERKVEQIWKRTPPA